MSFSIGVVCLVLLAVDVPIFVLLYRKIFSSRADFEKSVKYALTPDIISAMRRRYRQDWEAQNKLKLFLFLCFLLVVAEFILLLVFGDMVGPRIVF